MKTIKKKIPKFKTVDDEIDFWDKNDATDFYDFGKAQSVRFSNLKPSTKMISLRLPESLLERVKTLAYKNDIPYQSLIKILLSEKVNEEIEILYGKNKKPIAKIVPLLEQKK
jgi:predicted DNA binding CopG/RHH family protein